MRPRTARRTIALALALAAVGAIGTLLAGWTSPARTMHAYLGAFVFALSLALGGLVLVMIGYAVSVRWFVALRRIAEAISGTIPALALLALPLVLRPDLAYNWFEQAEAHGSWMSPRVVLVRGIIYFGVWALLTELLRAASVGEDRESAEAEDGLHDESERERERARTRTRARAKALSGVGLPIVGLTGSFAVFDVLMSSVEGWSSNVLGLYVLVGGFGAALGALAIALHLARRGGVLPLEVGPPHVHAVGRLLLVAVCLWSYLAATTLIIVWSANLPSEAAFYVPRAEGAWAVVSGVLVVGHFIVPFFALLPREAKHRSGYVAAVGGWLVLMHAVDCEWLAVAHGAPSPSLLDLLPYLAVSGVMVAVGVARYGRAAPLPLHDPDRERSLAYESP